MPTEAVGRGTVFLPDGLDLPQGSVPQAGARRLEKVGRKLRRRWQGGGRSAQQSLPAQRRRSAGPDTRRTKAAAWAEERLFQMERLYRLLSDVRKAYKAPFAECRHIDRNIAGNFVGPNRVIILKFSAHFVYNETSFNRRRIAWRRTDFSSTIKRTMIYDLTARCTMFEGKRL